MVWGFLFSGGMNMIDLLYAVKWAYRKHCLNDDSIGWEELSVILKDALCNAMGDEEFIIWLKGESDKTG